MSGHSLLLRAMVNAFPLKLPKSCKRLADCPRTRHNAISHDMAEIEVPNIIGPDHFVPCFATMPRANQRSLDLSYVAGFARIQRLRMSEHGEIQIVVI